jgi:ATP-binding cassette, subfamily B, bacterial
MSFLTISDLSFHYPNSKKEIFKDLNLVLEAGKSYALVGPTGEGKTTLAMLIAGLIKPQKGSIKLLDKDLNKYSRQELSQQIGFILQDPFLFEGSVRSNILYGNHIIKEPQELELILKDANLFDLISRFEEGLDTKVTNNSENISLGQKQIINFLRVILRKPSFVILDEATANLDTVTEQLLQKILDNLPPQTTKVIIAHRLNTVKDVDQKFQVAAKKVVIIK